MTHHSPGPAAAVISRSSAMAVRQVLNAFRDGWLLENRLRRAARMIAEDARRQGLRAEQMVVVLKREWAGLADVRRAPMDEGMVREFARRLVSLCIHEFYALAVGPGRAQPCCAG